MNDDIQAIWNLICLIGWALIIRAYVRSYDAEWRVLRRYNPDVAWWKLLCAALEWPVSHRQIMDGGMIRIITPAQRAKDAAKA